MLLPALCALGILWYATLGSIAAQRQEAETRIAARASSQADTFREQIHRQILELDQTLRIAVATFEADPKTFDLAAWRDRAAALSDISRDLLLADNHGLIVQATVPEAVGTNVAERDYFGYALKYGRLQTDAYISAPTVDPILRQWHMAVARWAHQPDGSFAGVFVADWRVSAIEDLFRSADLGARPIIELVSLTDGKLRAIIGSSPGSPDERVADSQMFAALRASPNGIWLGHSSPDGVVRMHAFRQIPGRDLVVVAGIDIDSAMAPADARADQFRLFAGGMSVLVLMMAGMLWHNATQARRRRVTVAYDRAMLAAADSRLGVVRAEAEAKTAQLEATLHGMSDGVAMMDAQLCLVEWNRQFPEIAGVPPGMLRIGLPMENILRAQAKGGQFGPVNVETEVTRRMALLRSGVVSGIVERTRPDGHTIELRRNRLNDGGFVTLYSDVTARKQAENALREARAVAEAAIEAKSRFVAIVSHEIRTPLNALLTTLTLLHDAGLPAAQQAVLDMARQSGDALLGLINDILEMSRMEAGQLSLRPGLFALRTLLESAIDMMQPRAAERRITLRLAMLPGLPRDLYADFGRLRQVLINLLSNAVKFGQPGPVGLLATAEQEPDGRRMLHLAVRDRGPMIEPEGRAQLFQPFSRLEAADAAAAGPSGSGLGLAICRQLVSLMGGKIGCDAWMSEDGTAGNEFWVRVPIAPLPPGAQLAAPEAAARRILPRTRILLVDDIPANRVVTAAMLRREGHMVDVTNNGEEALQAVARHPYDLVLMDVFMPGMNGYEVTRRIAALPAPAGTVPVVALTASVSPEERDNARKAGMISLVAKPVAMPELTAALAELAWPGRPLRSAEVTALPAVSVGPVLAPDRVSELRNSLPADMLGGMVEECLIDLHARLPALRHAVEAASGEEVAAQAHAMVGMAAGYGMTALEDRLRAVMREARAGNAARASVLAAELDQELSMAAAALREALAIEMV